MRRFLYFATGAAALLAMTWPRIEPVVFAGAAQAGQWVAFTADFHLTKTDGRVDQGRYYRRSDGSTRSELVGNDYRSIAIANIATNSYYVMRMGAVARTPDRAAAWTRQPLALPPGGYPPPEFRLNMPGMSPSSQVVSGFTTVRKQHRDGASHRLLAPDLNYFAVVTEMVGKTGSVRYEYFNIRLGEPDPALFLPPPGTTLTELSKPGGIVHTTSFGR